MKDFEDEIKKAVLAGVELYPTIKNCKTTIGDYEFTPIDKKYLSLLFGILTTNNEISKELRGEEIDRDFDLDDLERVKACSKIYTENNFSVIFRGVDFESIKEYYIFLCAHTSVNEYLKFSGKENEFKKIK